MACNFNCFVETKGLLKAQACGHHKWSRRPIEAEKHRRYLEEPWLLVNVNRKSQAAYHLPLSSASPNHRKGPKWPSARHIVSQPLGRYQLFDSVVVSVVVNTHLQ